jgi:hypothetical protein
MLDIPHSRIVEPYYVHPISVRIIYNRFGYDSVVEKNDTEAELGDSRKGWLQAV